MTLVNGVSRGRMMNFSAIVEMGFSIISFYISTNLVKIRIFIFQIKVLEHKTLKKQILRSNGRPGSYGPSPDPDDLHLRGVPQ